MSTPRSFPWRFAGISLFFLGVGSACSVFSQSRSPLQEHMAFHFAEIGMVQEALIMGDLEAAHEPARAIWLQTDHPDLPRGVDSPVHDLRRSAHRAASATSLPEAAQALGEMGAACSRCHEAADAGPALSVDFPPRGASDVERMRRHDWAAQRMWAGIIGADDAIWMAGAEALADATLVPESCPDCPEVAELAREVHDLGTEARRLGAGEARAGLYGRLITTCSGCHTRVAAADR